MSTVSIAMPNKDLEQQQQQQPAIGIPTQARPTSLVLTPVQRDGRQVFPDDYSLDLISKVSRAQMAAIVSELNATALKYGPRTGGAWAVLPCIPLVNVATHITWRAQSSRMRQELQKVCAEMNRRFDEAGSGGRVNLLYREVPMQQAEGPCRRRRRWVVMVPEVEVQVLDA